MNLRRGIFRVVLAGWAVPIVIWIGAIGWEAIQQRQYVEFGEAGEIVHVDLWGYERRSWQDRAKREGAVALGATVAVWGAYAIGLWITAGFRSPRD